MSVQVRRKILNMAQDGYFGVQDMREALHDVRDGRGITKKEKQTVINTLADVLERGDVHVTQQAYTMVRGFKHATRGYSTTKKVYAPNMDDAEYSRLLEAFSNGGREAAYDWHFAGSGESPRSVKTPARLRRMGDKKTRRASGGGEAAPSSRRTPARRAAGGGESVAAYAINHRTYAAGGE